MLKGFEKGSMFWLLFVIDWDIENEKERERVRVIVRVREVEEGD